MVDSKSREAIISEVLDLLADAVWLDLQGRLPAAISVTKWLTAQQAAKRAPVGVKIVYAAVKSGKLRAARIGGGRNLRFAADWIDQWLEGAAPQDPRRKETSKKSRAD